MLSRVDPEGKKTVWLSPGIYCAFDGADEIGFEVKARANVLPPAIRR